MSKIKRKAQKNKSVKDDFIKYTFGDIPLTTQDTIRFDTITQDGIIIIGDKYSKMVQFYDINYQLARNEDKNDIFERYCSFLNYFDVEIEFQILYINKNVGVGEYEDRLNLEEKEDTFNDVRLEYSNMLKNQLAKGNNGISKTKYIVFNIKEENIKMARVKLEKIETDIINNFKAISGVTCKSVNGIERLKVLHDILKQDSIFNYDWKKVKTLNNTKDCIAPNEIIFEKDIFKIDNHIADIRFLKILASELSDKLLAEILDTDKTGVVSFNVRPVDQSIAIKQIKRKITAIQKMKIEEQKKAVRSGYDMDIIPTDLNVYHKEAETLLEDLQNRNERLFEVVILFMNVAKTKEQLKNNIFQLNSLVQKHSCQVKSLDNLQEDGLMSVLPLANNKIRIKRNLTTTPLAIFIPFTTQELFSKSKEGLYYGLNALSNNLIVADRKELMNPNGLILGKPGAGKSFSAKREIANVFMCTDDEILICDPEAEYSPLVRKLGGEVIKISPSSKSYINPMDIELDSGEDDPIRIKSEFVLSLCELIVGSGQELEGTERTLIDRAVKSVYTKYYANPVPDNMPTLGDLHRELLSMKDFSAVRIATSLEIYVTGSLNIFNNRTNVDIKNRLISFDIKDLGNHLKKLGMLIVQDQVWARVSRNRDKSSNTRYYIDEFHLLLKEPQTANYSFETWKRFRKWGGIPTGITQNVKDLFASMEIENILENSDFIYMLSQGAGDREILEKRLNISTFQSNFIKNAEQGEGLIKFGNIIIPFKDKFPNDTTLYKIMTTKLDEVGHKGL